MRCQLSPATKCHQSKFPADSGELICYTMIVWIWNQLNSRLHRMMWNPPADPDEIGMFCSAAGQYYQQIGHDVRFTLLHQDLSCSKSSDQCMTAVQSLTQNDSIVICWCESALTLYSLSVQSTDNVLVICTGHLLYPWSTCGQQFYCCTAKGPNVSLGITEQARRWRGWMRDDVRWIGGVYTHSKVNDEFVGRLHKNPRWNLVIETIGGVWHPQKSLQEAWLFLLVICSIGTACSYWSFHDLFVLAGEIWTICTSTRDKWAN